MRGSPPQVCPGSCPCSAATRSSCRCRPSPCRPASPSGRSGRSVASRVTATTTPGTCNRARSNTRFATVSWPSSTWCPTPPTTGPTRRPRFTCGLQPRRGVGTAIATPSTAVRPYVERALSWIDTDGDFDGDGLQEYKTRAPSGGYYNQGWKDSGEAIIGADGVISALPIALCEHQGYVVAAKRAWADALADSLRRTRPGPSDSATRPTGWSSSIEDTVLVGGAGHVLPGPRRQQDPDRFRLVEPRPPPVGRGRGPGAGPPGGDPAVGSRHVERMGHPDAVQRSPLLQPLLLPARLRLAPRQRHLRRRLPPLRPRRRSRPGGPGPVRRGRPLPGAPPARAVRRPGPRRRRFPGAVSRCQRAPGLGGRRPRPPRHDSARRGSRCVRKRACARPGAAGLASRRCALQHPGRATTPSISTSHETTLETIA